MRPLLRLSVRRALEPALAKVALVIAVIITLIGGGAVFSVASEEVRPPLDRIAPLVSSALAWGSGMLLALGGASGSIARDQADGIWALAKRRGITARQFVLVRTLGLSGAVALSGLAGTALVGLLALSVSRGAGMAGSCARAMLGSCIYMVLFSVVIAPVALLAYAAGSRLIGYLVFTTLIVAPELVSVATRSGDARGWSELLPLPAALDAVRDALVGRGDLLSAGRGATVLLVVSLVLWPLATTFSASLSDAPAGDA